MDLVQLRNIFMTLFCHNYFTLSFLLNHLPFEEVVVFLEEAHLSEFKDRFEEERIDGALLLELDEDIMITELKMRRFDARKLTLAVWKLKKKKLPQ